ncbi:hypothetical protein ACQY0O_007774 [Thecaphora frezii]
MLWMFWLASARHHHTHPIPSFARVKPPRPSPALLAFPTFVASPRRLACHCRCYLHCPPAHSIRGPWSFLTPLPSDLCPSRRSSIVSTAILSAPRATAASFGIVAMPPSAASNSDDEDVVGTSASGGLGLLLASLPSSLSACLPYPSTSQQGRIRLPEARQDAEAASSGSRPAGSHGWASLFGGGSASSPGRSAPEARSLLRDDYDDSDAISLLSNIAERDARGSAASRRRARARRRAARENNGMGWSDVGQLMACGLFGRAKGQIHSRDISRGNQSLAHHRRTLSESSAESDGSSFNVAARVDSGDEDAGMLDDQDIRNFSLASPPTIADRDDTTPAGAGKQDEAQSEAQEAEEARSKAEAEAEAAATEEVERKKKIKEEAVRLKEEAEEEAAKQQEEEARLAAEEEAAIAKARRRAKRKAAKAGLLKLKEETKAAQRWRTEAEAEAAAGGFDFAVEEALHDGYDDEGAYQEHGQQQYFDDGQGHPQDYYNLQGAEDEESFYYPREPQGYDRRSPVEHVVEEHQQGIVHHHHYYHHAPPQVHSGLPAAHAFLSPTLSQPLSNDASPQLVADQFDDAQELEATRDTAVQSEDEADIAGLSFGKRRTKRNDSESGSRSGGGRTGRIVPGAAGSQTSGGSGSAGGYRAYANVGPMGTSMSSAASSSRVAGTKPSYRDRPRRHERQGSRSSNSSTGLHAGPGRGEVGGYARASAASPNASAGGMGTHTVPTLPNLYEQDTAAAVQGQASLYAPGPFDTQPQPQHQQQYQHQHQHQQHPLPELAGVLGMGGGQKKRSYREKRSGNGETASVSSNNSSTAASNIKITSPVVASLATTPASGGGFNLPRNPTEFGRWREREPEFERVHGL